jgi:predicted RNA-binding protein YlxR (DUF448 family)
MSAAPRRTCIGCRRVSAPTTLTRVVRSPDGAVSVGRHLPGRGAWLCTGSAPCFDAATKRRAFGRSLRAAVSTAEIQELRAKLFGLSGQPTADQ